MSGRYRDDTLNTWLGVVLALGAIMGLVALGITFTVGW